MLLVEGVQDAEEVARHVYSGRVEPLLPTATLTLAQPLPAPLLTAALVCFNLHMCGRIPTQMLGL